MPFFKSRPPKSEEEKRIDAIGSGEWKAGFTAYAPSLQGYRYEQYRFVVPVPEEKLAAALQDAARALTALPAGQKGLVAIKVVSGEEVEETYGKGMYAVVIKEKDYHSIFQSESRIGSSIKGIGKVMFESYAPDNIKKAFGLLVLKRGREDSTDH